MIEITSTTNGRDLIEEARRMGKRAKTKTGRPAKRDMRTARTLREKARDMREPQPINGDGQ